MSRAANWFGMGILVQYEMLRVERRASQYSVGSVERSSRGFAEVGDRCPGEGWDTPRGRKAELLHSGVNQTRTRHWK